MIHPLFKLIATRPQLLADHLEAYAELVVDEVGSAASRLKQGLMLQVVAVCCVGIASVLAGVSLLLWAVIPQADIHAPWALFVAPAVPLLAALFCIAIARGMANQGALDKVTAQVRADMAMFREASAA